MTGATTPESRIKAIQNAALHFSIHLKSSPGTILTATQRLGIAICARDALKCTGCNDALRVELCPLNLYEFCSEMKHEPFPVPTGNTVGDERIENCLLAIIHTIVCFQCKINDGWYKDCIRAIQSCGILSNYIEDVKCANDANEIQLASHAAFCEIVVLTAWSSGINSTFLALDKIHMMPKLPSWEDVKSAPKPMHIRFSALLHRVRQDDSVAAAPYFNTNSIEYGKIGCDTWNKLMFGPVPWICTVFIPKDVAAFLQYWMNVVYLTPREMFLSWGEMGTKRHCATVTRHDIETVAGAVAAQHNCDF